MESDKRDTEAILSSLNCLKKVISPIELSVQRAVKNLEEFSVGVHKKSVSRKFHKIQSSKQNCKIVNNEEEKEENSCLTYLKFTNSLSVLVVNLLQVFPVKNTKCLKKQCTRQEKITPDYGKQFKSKTGALEGEKVDTKKANLSLELLLEMLLFNFTQKFIQNSHLGIFKSALKGRTEVDSLHATLSFARFGRVPSILGGVIPSENLAVEPDSTCNRDEPENNSMPKTTYEFLTIPLTNVERLRSTLSTVSLTELVELLPPLGRSPSDHPDKKKLFSVQDFYKYTEAEGRRFFDELDRDGDGQVTLEDLELAMKKRRLPQIYAREFLHRTRSHLFAKSFEWKQFLSLMEQKEPTILRAYNTLCLSKSGTLQKSQILASLTNAGLPANEDNAAAMMRFLNADIKGSISYSHFRDFMLLLPPDRLEDDPRNIWFEAATVVAVAPPVAIPTENVLKSALAGGLSCALSAFMMHPVDTVKTRVQASTLSFPELLSKLPQIGFHGLYRGSIPAVLGQFSSHGLRTGIFEASKLVLLNVTPNLPEIQVQSLASFCSTVLGTAARIPCEVLKQRLQAGIFDNVGEAFVGTLHRDGVKGFFRGTGATLCREVPFYVAGLGLYAESKKVVQRLLNRDLEPWEVIVVGGLSGGLAAITTTPFDVIKTRMMTTQGLPVSMTGVAFSILRQDGPLGLFKGAVPRFFWIAPLGAMNFAGYELAKKALCKNEYPVNESLVSSKEAH